MDRILSEKNSSCLFKVNHTTVIKSRIPFLVHSQQCPEVTPDANSNWALTRSLDRSGWTTTLWAEHLNNRSSKTFRGLAGGGGGLLSKYRETIKMPAAMWCRPHKHKPVHMLRFPVTQTRITMWKMDGGWTDRQMLFLPFIWKQIKTYSIIYKEYLYK